MDPLATRVAGRVRIAESMGDPKELVLTYESIVSKMQLPQEQLDSAKAVMQRLIDAGLGKAQGISDPAWDEAWKTSIKASGRVTQGWPLVHGPGSRLFLAIIQTYTLPPALRKKIEIASRAYMKSMRPRFKVKSFGPERYLEYITVYEKVMAVWWDHLAAAKEAIAKGKEHSAEGEGATKLNVGPFVVVNTGGFSDAHMAGVVEVVKKATTFIQHAGLGEVCYGDIQVTNTVHKGTVWAFYMPSKDELFVRANLKSSIDVVHNVIHELGHRYDHKFLKDKSALDRLYRAASSEDDDDVYENLKFPAIGDTITDKGETYVVTGNDLSKLKVHLKLVDSPLTAKVHVSGFWAMKGEPLKKVPGRGFVTPYAKKSPSENFAEMFAFYCMGRLTPAQTTAFKEAVTGVAKTASERVVERHTRSF
jgi:hypothetical protein